MQPQIMGIHHITAIAGDPQQNLDFYTRQLGLRLVKTTVNYDDPYTYHLYYGDEFGSPGTIITFFPYINGFPGRRGTGQSVATSFIVPAGALDYWVDRFSKADVPFQFPFIRFDEEVLTFTDPDGLQLELIAQTGVESRPAWERGGVPVEHAIRGFHGSTFAEGDLERTHELLTKVMGFRFFHEAGNRFRYAIGEGDTTAWIDLLHEPDSSPGRVAVGSIHHIAWRTPDDNHQEAWLQRLQELSYRVSPVMDRQYFHSIYFREPGGVLFEIATDGPGMMTDEAPDELGSSLRLPAWHEPLREQIELRLPELKR